MLSLTVVIVDLENIFDDLKIDHILVNEIPILFIN